MNLYGEPENFGPGILINPTDYHKVDPTKWDGILIPSEEQEQGKVTFCRIKWVDVGKVSVPLEDPTRIDTEVLIEVVGNGSTATIGPTAGALTFVFELEK